MSKKIKVLSLFDGISCAQLALKQLGYAPEYYASEILPEAIEVTKAHHPETTHVGDVRELKPPGLFAGNFDLLIGGSPCQDLSVAKQNREGLKGKRSSLFYEYVRILKEAEPKYFVLENVGSMSVEDRDIITAELGVEPVMIDAALVSAQRRKRYFWTNIKGIEQPVDRGIVIRDILQEGVEREYLKTLNPRKTKSGIAWDTSGKGHCSTNDRAYSLDGKHPTVPTARTMTKCNVFNVEVVKHILSYL